VPPLPLPWQPRRALALPLPVSGDAAATVAVVRGKGDSVGTLQSACESPCRVALAGGFVAPPKGLTLRSGCPLVHGTDALWWARGDAGVRELVG
jgi:hypothetical protein